MRERYVAGKRRQVASSKFQCEALLFIDGESLAGSIDARECTAPALGSLPLLQKETLAVSRLCAGRLFEVH